MLVSGIKNIPIADLNIDKIAKKNETLITTWAKQAEIFISEIAKKSS